MQAADKIQSIAPFYVMDLLARAREMEAAGRDVIHLEIGEPDFSAPEPVVAAAISSLEQGLTHYTPALGLPELRQAIAGFYTERYGVAVDESRVAVTPGASGALQLVLGAIINPGDEVLMADPGYPCNRHFVRLLGGVDKNIPVGSETGYQLTPELIENALSSRSRAVMIASPSNPTGTLIPRDTLADIVALCRQHDLFLIVDEIYLGLTYGIEEHTAAAYEDVFVINSFSKYFGMTGMRAGWLIAPEQMMDAIDRQAQNVFLATATPAQYAALAAFKPDTISILEARRKAFQTRRDYLLPEIERLGFKIKSAPEGAFYLYVDCSDFTRDSFTFCLDILEQVGVALTPGKDFGSHRHHQHLRIAYTRDLPVLKEAVARLGTYLGSL